ncbi:MAG TPA: hypothetical protein DCY79_17140 [Planctomycetaceae bacterium]|nr:hypothetical protein [Planctomycetaceae bacterium]|tara:strand:- start:708 stop:1103 length:396 start_codon:yes stop_codon:yes gene_type:complete
MTTDYQHISIQTIDQALVITIQERQLRDYGLAKALEQEMKQAVAESEYKNTVLDMEPVVMMTSSSLLALLGLRVCVREAAAELVLCNLQVAVAEALTVSQLLVERRNVGAHFRLAENVPAALAMLQQQHED